MSRFGKTENSLEYCAVSIGKLAGSETVVFCCYSVNLHMIICCRFFISLGSLTLTVIFSIKYFSVKIMHFFNN